MLPKIDVPIDDLTFRRAIGVAQRRAAVARGCRRDPVYAPPVPLEIGLQLTDRCNLRCSHCFQYGEDGLFQQPDFAARNVELDIGIVRRLLEETREVGAKVFLWGGEPLVYRHWDELADLLAAHGRRAVVCTNGIAVEKKIDSLVKVRDLVALISIDGFEEENDALRGRNSFRRVMRGVDALLERQRAGEFTGQVSVNSVLSDALVPRVYELAEFFEDKGVNTLHLSLPWYMSRRVASDMDEYYATHFAWLGEQGLNRYSTSVPSWYAYNFRLSPDRIEPLMEQVERIAAREWGIRIRYNPQLDPREMREFLEGRLEQPGGRTRCYSIATRLNVLPNGDVTTCKLFPELTIGSLATQSLEEVWRGANVTDARGTLAAGLTPVCSKCTQLFQGGE